VSYLYGPDKKEACPSGSYAFVDGSALDLLKSYPLQTSANAEKATDAILMHRKLNYFFY
jgi:hypothetical protein